MARFVCDLEQHVGWRAQLGQHLGEDRRERGVEDEGTGLRVLEQVTQLLADVAVVDVERRDAGPVRAEHGLEVLVAVVEGERDVVLARLPSRQPLALVVRPQPAAVQVGGQAARPLGQLRVGEAPVAPDDALPVGYRLDQGVEGLGQVELHGRLRLRRRRLGGVGHRCTLDG